MLNAANTAPSQHGLTAASLLPVISSTLGLPGGGYQLDLSSSAANIAMGNNLFHGAASVTINAGSQSLTFHPGDHVTAAQFVAIKEVLAGGSQTIQLAGNGTASGGTFSLNQVVSPRLSLLVVPQSVTAIDLQSSNAPLTIHGDLINYGSIYDVSTKTGITSGSIFAKDITNEAGGVISNQLPSSLASSLGSGINGNALSGSTLVLGAGDTLSNAGSITSSGHLSLITGTGDINNNAGTIHAAGNVNLLTGSGNLGNSGAISSQSGNINVASNTPGNNININAQGGTFQATAGAINVRDASYTGAGNINISGGNYQSQNLNLYAGTGAITGTVGQVSGTLNTEGDAAHFVADSPELVLGNNCIKGDPLFANTGSINISGAITANEDLTIVAGGDITADPGSSLSTANVVVSTASAAYNPSTDITLIAGAGVSLTGTPVSSIMPLTPPSGGQATVDFSVSNGGNINLGNATINTSSQQPVIPPLSGEWTQPNGGNVTLVAIANGATGGTVTTGNIDTSSVNGNGGNVTVIASQFNTPGTNIQIGNITTGGSGVSNFGPGAGGNVSLYTTSAGLSSGTQITFNADGSSTGGTIIAKGGSSDNVGVVVGMITTGQPTFGSGNSNVGGSVNFLTGNVLLGGPISTQATQSGSVSFTLSGTLNTGGKDITTSSTAFNNPGNAGNIRIIANTVTAANLITSGVGKSAGGEAGNIAVTAAGNITIASADASANSNTLAGDVVLISGSTLTVTSPASTAAISGRNVLLGGLDGISVSSAGGSKTITDIQATGSIIATAGEGGSTSHAASISIAGGITLSGPRPDIVELVNNSPTTGNVNLTVGGSIVTGANNFGGIGGSVALVSSGAILAGNINTSFFSGKSPRADGGDVFISSGGTGKNAITVGTITTSGITGGNVILISPGTKNALNPTNIKHGTVTMTGTVAKGLSLFAALNVADVLGSATTINISETITGANAINIRPGGYQIQENTSTVNLTINNPDTAMVAPITVAGADGSNNSLKLGTVTQQNGSDNINIIASGQINLASDLQTGVDTGSVVLSGAGIGELTGKNFNVGINSQSTAILFSTNANGVAAKSVIVNAGTDIVVTNPLTTSGLNTNGGPVIMNSQVGGITTDVISTSAFGSGSAGPINLTAISIISTAQISATGPNGGGTVVLSSTSFEGTGIKTGDINNSPNGLLSLSVSGNRDEIFTGNINSQSSSPGISTNVILNSKGFVRTGDITTASSANTTGSISITAGQAGAWIGNIDTSSVGGNAGSVFMSGSSANGTLAVASINASVTSAAGAGLGGNVIISAPGSNINWGPGGINVSASGTGPVRAGNVILQATNEGSGGQVCGNGINATSSGAGGNVSVTGNTIFMSSIDVSSTNSNAGNVALGGGTGGITTTNITATSPASGGSVLQLASSFIVNIGAVNTSGQLGGNITAISGGNGAYFAQDIIATGTSGSGNAAGGNVLLVSQQTFVEIANGIDTSAVGATGAQAGSIGVNAGNGFFQATTVNTSALAGNGGATAVAGDVFISSNSTSNGISTSTGINTLNTGALASVTKTGVSIFVTQSGTYPVTNLAAFTNAPNFFTGNSSTLPATITVTPGSTNIIGGLYNTIGSSSTPASLTLDLGGDSRMLVPIASQSGMFVAGANGDNTAVGNGSNVILVSTNSSIALSGNITANPSGPGTQGNVTLISAGGFGQSVSQSAGTINGNNVTMASLGFVGATGINTPTVSPMSVSSQTVTADAFAISSSSSVFIVAATPSSTLTTLGLNLASTNGGTFSIASGINASVVDVGANSLVVASIVSLVNSAPLGSVQIDGLVLAAGTSGKINLQAPTVNVTGSAIGSTVLVATGSVNNTGTLAAISGILGIDNQAGSLTVTGGGNFISPVALSLSATGTLDFGGLISGGTLPIQAGESLVMAAFGDITAIGAGNFSINTSSTGGNGGSVSMLAGTNYSISSAGVISVDTTNGARLPGGTITLDGSNGSFALTSINTSSTSGAAGSVLFIAQGEPGTKDLILLPTELSGGSITSTGLTQAGSVNLFALGDPTAGTAVQVGAINIGGPGNARGGIIDLETCTIDPNQQIIFTNGAPSLIPTTAPGGAGSIVAGTLTTNVGAVLIDAQNNVTVNFTNAGINSNDLEINARLGTLNLPVSTITAAQNPDGSGGEILLNAGTINWPSMATVPLILNADANQSISANGGTIIFEQVNNIPIAFGNGSLAANSIEMSAVSGKLGGGGGELFVFNGGTVNFDPTFYNAAPQGANGFGAFYHLEGSTITLPSTKFAFNVNGVGIGSGGEIDFVQDAPGTNLTVSATTLQFSATSGLLGGDGGAVFVASGGDLTVDPTQIKVGPLGKVGNGGFIGLQAGDTTGPGNLQVSAPINVSGKGTTATGGEVSLTSNSPLQFVIGAKTSKTIPPPVNGMVGIVTATGKNLGIVDVENNGDGGLTNATALTAFRVINFTTENNGTITIGAGLGTINKTQVTLNATGSGNITTTSNTNAISGNSVALVAGTGDIFGKATTDPLTVTANAMQISGDKVNIIDKAAVQFEGVSATTSFTFNDAKNIQLENTVTAPSITLISNGIVNDVSFSPTTPGQIQTSNLTIGGTGSFLLSNSGSTITITPGSAAKAKSFNLTSSTDIDVSGTVGGTTGLVTLGTSDTADIITSTATDIVAAKTLTLTSTGTGTIGTGSGLNVNAAAVTASGNNTIRIVENAATSTLQNMTTTGGDIVVTTSGAAKVLQTLAAVGKVSGAHISAQNGIITLQNNNTTTGSIIIGKGSQIATSGATGGDVTISIGVAKNVNGTAPAGVVYKINGSTVTPPPPFTGDTFIFNNGITVAGTSTKSGSQTIAMNSNGAGVIFDTGGLKATAIKVNGNTVATPTTITGDPSVVGAPQESAQPATATTPMVVPSTSDTGLGRMAVVTLPAVTPSSPALPLTTTASTATAITIAGWTGNANTVQAPYQSIQGVAAGISASAVSSQMVGQRSAISNLLGSQTQDPLWASETELSNGQIPAVVYSEEDMGIHGEFTTIVDMQTLSTNDAVQSPNAGDEQVSAIGLTMPAALSASLLGGVSKSYVRNREEKHSSAINKTISLKHGTVVFAPAQNTVVDTPLGQVSIAANSLVVVTVNGDGVAVFDLDDTRGKAVTINSGRRVITLAPGRHALLTGKLSAPFADVNSTQFIGFRNIREHETIDGVKAFSSEFSQAHAIFVIQPLKQMVVSQNPKARKVAAHMIKTMSIVSSLNTSLGSYQQILKPRATAWAPWQAQ